jgi:hypothetical protein
MAESNDSRKNDESPNNLDELAKYILSHVPNEFRPSAFYNVDGDEIHVYWEDEPAYGKEITGVMCLMIGQDTGKVVGLDLYSIKKILREAGFDLVRRTGDDQV